MRVSSIDESDMASDNECPKREEWTWVPPSLGDIIAKPLYNEQQQRDAYKELREPARKLIEKTRKANIVSQQPSPENESDTESDTKSDSASDTARDDGDRWEQDSSYVPDTNDFPRTYSRNHLTNMRCGDEFFGLGCVICHKSSKNDDLKSSWFISLPLLDYSAIYCTSCDMLWQAVIFAQSHSLDTIHSIRLEYVWMTGQLQLWTLDEQGHQSEHSPYEFYRCGEHTNRELLYHQFRLWLPWPIQGGFLSLC